MSQTVNFTDYSHTRAATFKDCPFSSRFLLILFVLPCSVAAVISSTLVAINLYALIRSYGRKGERDLGAEGALRQALEIHSAQRKFVRTTATFRHTPNAEFPPRKKSRPICSRCLESVVFV